MKYSQSGQKFCQRSSITLLMGNLSEGLRTLGAIMLGSSNSANILQIEKYLSDACAALLSDGTLTHAIGNYDGP